MKKLLIYVLVLLSIIGMATAQLIVPDVNLGGDGQEKSNPDDKNYVYLDHTIQLTNTGDTDLTDLVISSDALSKYNVTFSPATISTLAANSSVNVVVHMYVHEDTDAFFPGRSDPQLDRQNDLGSVTVAYKDENGTTMTPVVSDLTLEVENQLVFDEINIKVEGSTTDEDNYDDGDEIEDIRPGDKITIEFVVKNNYRSGDDIDFEEVEVDVESDDSDFEIDDDAPFEINDGDVDSGEEEIESFTYEVPDDLDESTYTVTFILTGEEAETGAVHGELWTLDFVVEKNKRDIVIKSAALSEDVLSCNRETVLTVRLQNLGSKDSDEIVLEISNDKLGIIEKELGIDLDEGDKSDLFTIPLSIDEDQ